MAKRRKKAKKGKKLKKLKKEEEDKFSILFFNNKNASHGNACVGSVFFYSPYFWSFFRNIFNRVTFLTLTFGA